MCGKSDLAENFWTKEQIKIATEQGENYISGTVGNALKRDAREFNIRQKANSLIKISMAYEGNIYLRPLVPIEAKEEMQLKVQCEKCNANFAVIGSAFFCPCCGYSSVLRIFSDSIRKIDSKIKHLDRIVQTVGEFDKDEAELTRRSLLESCISDGVVSFQRVMEELFKNKYPDIIIPLNTFQNIDLGSNLCNKKLGVGYSHYLSEDELSKMNVYFQRRHILAHKDGMVDQRYIDKCGDTSYAVGQRLVIKKEDVESFVSIIKKLVEAYMRVIHD